MMASSARPGVSAHMSIDAALCQSKWPICNLLQVLQAGSGGAESPQDIRPLGGNIPSASKTTSMQDAPENGNGRRVSQVFLGFCPSLCSSLGFVFLHTAFLNPLCWHRQPCTYPGIFFHLFLVLAPQRMLHAGSLRLETENRISTPLSPPKGVDPTLCMLLIAAGPAFRFQSL